MPSDRPAAWEGRAAFAAGTAGSSTRAFLPPFKCCPALRPRAVNGTRNYTCSTFTLQFGPAMALSKATGDFACEQPQPGGSCLIGWRRAMARQEPAACPCKAPLPVADILQAWDTMRLLLSATSTAPTSQQGSPWARSPWTPQSPAQVGAGLPVASLAAPAPQRRGAPVRGWQLVEQHEAWKPAGAGQAGPPPAEWTPLSSWLLHPATRSVCGTGARRRQRALGKVQGDYRRRPAASQLRGAV